MIAGALIFVAMQGSVVCTPVFGSVHCGPSLGTTLRRKREEEKQWNKDSILGALKERMGVLIRNNRCDEARNMALEYNEIELAFQAKSMCEHSEPAQVGNRPVIIRVPEEDKPPA